MEIKYFACSGKDDIVIMTSKCDVLTESTEICNIAYG